MIQKKILACIFLGLLLVGCSGSFDSIPTPEVPVPSAEFPTEADSITLLPLDTPFPIPTDAPTEPPVPTEEPVPTEIPPGPLTITIVYDNIREDWRLTADLGYSAYIQYHDQTILFDTGGNSDILLQNMQILEIDPASIEAVVLSHIHDDHTGGLEGLLSVTSQPPVYLHSAFPGWFIERTEDATEVIETEPGQEIATDIFTTGEVSGDIPEQALAILTSRGLVVITGCAHPGIVRMVEQAIEVTGEPVYLVMGGFHLGEASYDEIEAIIEELQDLGVHRVAPSHCTGELATRLFAEAYGDHFIEVGVGSVITIEN